MHIGIKNGNIVVFNDTLEKLEINAAMKGITLDSVEETDEEILPSHNTANDGIYYKASQVPPVPTDLANAIVRENRRELYQKLSDPLTNNIAVLRDKLAMENYSTGEEKAALECEIAELYQERKDIRQQIIDENCYL